MSYFIYQNQKIYYKITGSPNKKPLIMLHGDTASSVMFELLLPLYQENFQVVLMDFLETAGQTGWKNSLKISGLRSPGRSLR